MLQKILLILLFVASAIQAEVTVRSVDIVKGSQITKVPYGWYTEKFQKDTLKVVDKLNLSANKEMNIYTGYGVYDKNQNNCQYLDFAKNQTMESEFTKIKVVSGKTYAISLNKMSFSQCEKLTADYQGVPATPSSSSLNYSLFGDKYNADEVWVGLRRASCTKKWKNGWGIEQTYTNLSSDPCLPVRLNVYKPAGSSSWEFSSGGASRRCMIEIDSKDFKRPIKVCAPWWMIDTQFKTTSPRDEFDMLSYQKLDVPKVVPLCTQYDTAALSDYNKKINDKSKWGTTQCSQYFSVYKGEYCMDDLEQPFCKANECQGYIENTCEFVKKYSSLIKDYQKGTVSRNGVPTEVKVKSGIVTLEYKCPPSKPSMKFCLKQEDVRLFAVECPGSHCSDYYDCLVAKKTDCETNHKYYCEKVWGNTDGAIYDSSGNIVKVKAKCEGPSWGSSSFVMNDNIEVLRKIETKCFKYSEINTTKVEMRKCTVKRNGVDVIVGANLSDADIYKTNPNCVRTNDFIEARPSKQVEIEFTANKYMKTLIQKVPISIDMNETANATMNIGSIAFSSVPRPGTHTYGAALSAIDLAVQFDNVEALTIGDAGKTLGNAGGSWASAKKTGTMPPAATPPKYFNHSWFQRRLSPFKGGKLESILTITGNVFSNQGYVSYAWADLPYSTNMGLLNDDTLSGAVDIGFDFPFWGKTFKKMCIDTNGNVRLGATCASQTSIYKNTELNSSSAPTYSIYPYWDDLMQETSAVNSTDPSLGRLLLKKYPDRVVITWDNNQYYNGTTRASIQLIMHKSGNVDFRYKNTGGRNGNSATIGIKGKDNTEVMQTSYNTPNSASDGTAVRYGYTGSDAVYVSNDTTLCTNLQTHYSGFAPFLVSGANMSLQESTKYAEVGVSGIDKADACYVEDVTDQSTEKWNYFKNNTSDGVVLFSKLPMSISDCEKYADDLSPTGKNIAFKLVGSKCYIDWRKWKAPPPPPPVVKPANAVISDKKGKFVFTQKGYGEIFAIQNYLDGAFGYKSTYTMPFVKDNTIKLNSLTVSPIIPQEDLAIDQYYDYYYRNNQRSINDKEGTVYHIPGMDGEFITDGDFAGYIAAAGNYANPFYGGAVLATYVWSYFTDGVMLAEVTNDYRITKQTTSMRYTPNPYGYDNRKKTGTELLLGWHHIFSGTVKRDEIDQTMADLLAGKRLDVVDGLGFNGESGGAFSRGVGESTPGMMGTLESNFKIADDEPEVDFWSLYADEDKTESGTVSVPKQINTVYMGAVNSVSIFVPYMSDYDVMALDKKMNIIGKTSLDKNSFFQGTGKTDYAYANFAVNPLFNLAEGIVDGNLSNACRFSPMVEWGGGVSGVYYEESIDGNMAPKSATPCQKSVDEYVQSHSAHYLAIKPSYAKKWYLIKLIKPLPYANRVYITTFRLQENRNYTCYDSADCSLSTN